MKIHCNSPMAYVGAGGIDLVTGIQHRYHYLNDNVADGVFVRETTDVAAPGSTLERPVLARSFCGRAGYVRYPNTGIYTLAPWTEGITVPNRAFAFVPLRAQCGTCRKHTDGRFALEEHVLSVEAFLHSLARLFATDHAWLEEISLFSYTG